MIATTGRPAEGLQELAELGRQIRARGWHRKHTGRIVAELALHVTLAVAAFVLFVTVESWWLRALAVVAGTIAQFGVGLNSHTATHQAASDRPWVNDVLLYLGYPVLLGLSATYWRHSHVTVHHHNPVVIGVDDDFDLRPWFALNDVDIEAASGWRREYYARWQWLFLPLALVCNGPGMMLGGLRYLAGKLRDPARRGSAHWLDLVALGAHWSLWVLVPMLWLPAGDVLAFYALRLGLVGYVMFAVFAPGHYPAEAAGRLATAPPLGFIALQTAHTLNFRAGWLGRFYVAGLDYQIEHHLFPGMSHLNYPKIAPLVQEFCRRHGYPYRAFSWGEGLWKSLAVFRTPKRVVRDVAVIDRHDIGTSEAVR